LRFRTGTACPDDRRVENDAEFAVGEGETIRLVFVIDPGPDRFRLGAHLIDVDDWLLGLVAQGQQFVQAAAVVRAERQRRDRHAVDQILGRRLLHIGPLNRANGGPILNKIMN
jgi:hypothetical protein